MSRDKIVRNSQITFLISKGPNKDLSENIKLARNSAIELRLPLDLTTRIKMISDLLSDIAFCVTGSIDKRHIASS